MLGLGAAAVVVVVFGLTRGHWLEGVLAGIATAMAMLPEEFPVVLTVFLALGAWRMSQRNVLTRRSAVIETLGSATVICVDKTGTLTMNTMTVRELMVDGSGHVLDGEPLPERVPRDRGVRGAGLARRPVRSDGPGVQGRRRHLPRRHRAPARRLDSWCGSTRSRSSCSPSRTSGSRPTSADYVIAAKGAPEAIADLCHLDDAASSPTLTEQVEAATAGGLRVLAVARARFSHDAGPARPSSTTSTSSTSAWPVCTTRCAQVSPTRWRSVAAPGCASS